MTSSAAGLANNHVSITSGGAVFYYLAAATAMAALSLNGAAPLVAHQCWRQ
jgi:hypothetical protein